MPEEFLFCFTLDTEPDDLWGASWPNTFDHFDLLPDFHRQLVEAGARPTYLTTSEVAESGQGRRAMIKLLESGHCEIGVHFHTWTRQWPFEVPDFGRPGKPRFHAMAHQLGQEIEERMMAYTCRVLRNVFDVEPRSHRGGRFSFGADTVRSLINCGIEVDSTVTPGLSWLDRSHHWLDGPDFSNFPCRPYLLTGGKPSSNKTDGRDKVLELPVGAFNWPGWTRGICKNHLPREIVKWLGRSVGLRLGHRYLDPTRTSVRDMCAVMQGLRTSRCPVWVFMIHSSQILPCARLPKRKQVRDFIRRCLAGIRVAVELGARPATLKEAAQYVLNNNLVETGKFPG